LFAALEGVMSLFHSDSENLTRYNLAIAEYLDNEHITLLALPILSLTSFLSEYFQSVCFDEEAEEYVGLNRHLALHGRYHECLTKVDAIKLFIALSTALFINAGLINESDL
jgi:hypothetical protein